MPGKPIILALGNNDSDCGDYQIDPSHLAVVVFVHDDKTKHVLQAGYVDLGSESTHPTLEANIVR